MHRREYSQTFWLLVITPVHDDMYASILEEGNILIRIL